jgi:hypothetical protein
MPSAGFEAVLRVLETAEVANVRQYADTVALQLLRRRPALLRARVLPLLRDCSSSGSHALSSLILVAARAAALGLARPQAAGAAAEEQQQQQPRRAEQRQQEPADGLLLGEVAEAVAPWALSHVHALRTFAQLVLWRLYELLPALPARDATAAALLRFFRRAGQPQTRSAPLLRPSAAAALASRRPCWRRQRSAALHLPAGPALQQPSPPPRASLPRPAARTRRWGGCAGGCPTPSVSMPLTSTRP